MTPRRLDALRPRRNPKAVTANAAYSWPTRRSAARHYRARTHRGRAMLGGARHAFRLEPTEPGTRHLERATHRTGYLGRSRAAVYVFALPGRRSQAARPSTG